MMQKATMLNTFLLKELNVLLDNGKTVLFTVFCIKLYSNRKQAQELKKDTTWEIAICHNVHGPFFL